MKKILALGLSLIMIVSAFGLCASATEEKEDWSKYPLIMDAEEKGDYTKATELLQIDEKASELVKVNINYRLYKVAKVAGLEEEAAKHRAYVLEKGGDTFYKKELENVG